LSGPLDAVDELADLDRRLSLIERLAESAAG
jgi:hypothetical protein